MHKLQIDLDYLIFAWQDDDSKNAYYLDTDTGSVLMVARDLDDVDELREEIELQPARFLYVPKPQSQEIELDLSDFVFSVGDTKLKDLLSVACEGTNKLAACKKILSAHQDELARWGVFRKEAVRERVRRWLAANNLEAES